MNGRSLCYVAPMVLEVAFASASWAADKAGAEAILRDYAATYGNLFETKNVLSVTPDGTEYRVVWHLQKLVDGLTTTGVNDAINVEDFIYRLTETRADAWTIRADQFPSISFKGPTKDGVTSGRIGFEGYTFSSTYDAQLPEFHHSTTHADTVNAAFQITDPKSSGSVDILESGLNLDTHVSSASEGLVDASLYQVLNSVVENVRTSDGAPVAFRYSSGASLAAAAVVGMRGNPFIELARWIIANGDAPQTPSNQSELKTRIVAALPLWNQMTGRITIKDVAIDAPFFSLAAKSLTQSVEFSGLTHAGSAEFGLELEGVSAKSALLPPLAEEFMPASLDLDLKFSMTGLDDIVRIALDDQDIRTKQPLSKDAEERIAAIVEQGSPKLVVAPGHFTTPSIDLAFEGELAIKPGRAPGHFILKAKNFDKTVDLIKRLSDSQPNAEKMSFFLTFIKGLGTTGADGQLIWVVDLSSTGAVTINGTLMPTNK
jgi:hypothetical protein